MKVERLDHFHIGVNDLDRAVKFFSDLLNTKFCQLLESEPEDDVRATVCTLGGVGLELFTGQAPDGPMSELLGRRGEGCYGISLKVPDVDEAIAEVQARGLRIVRRTPAGSALEAHIHPKDTYGVMIELCQYEWQHPGLAQALNKVYGEYRGETSSSATGGRIELREETGLRVEGVDHVYVGVRDLDKAVEFFSGLLCTSFSEVIQTDAEGDTKATGCNLGGVGVVMFTGLTPDGWVSKLLRKRGEGCYGISLKVPDVDEAIAEVQARDLRVMRRAAVGNLIGARIHPKDTFGVMIELCQYETQHPGVAQLLNKAYDKYRPEG